ncbi:MAG: RNA methyltransferase [Bifidobacteriaceae bacterium]|jgi:tRNA G18 (ribose-2'-O)-methylase SpoU|nr:RNA methyltransferase [Bifidobacteriaceae bacterium]
MIERIRDPADPRLGPYTQLKDVALRRIVEPAQGLFMAESVEVIGRALDAGIGPRSVLLAEPAMASARPLLTRLGEDVPVYVGTYDLLRAITGFHLHRGVLAAMTRPALPRLEAVLGAASESGANGGRRIAVLEDIVDHTNVGAIIRAAAGLGVNGVLVTPQCADPLYRRAVRVSMGTVFQVPWTRIAPWPSGIVELREAGFTVAAMALTEDAIPLDEYARRGLPQRLALLLGTEGAGLGAPSIAAADAVIRIPMSGGVDSLNVAAAAAVAFWATRPGVERLFP